jgi:hypothetical protein
MRPAAGHAGEDVRLDWAVDDATSIVLAAGGGPRVGGPRARDGSVDAFAELDQ